MYEKYLRNKTQELKGNIRVFCRIRPVITDMDGNDDIVCQKGVKEIINIKNLHKIEVWTSIDGFKAGSQKICNNSMISQSFNFDAVFGHLANQEDLFKEVYHLVMSALDGYKICIFAYGQTGSGKTYTMEGNYQIKKERGIIPRAVESLFMNIEKNKGEGWNYEIEASFQEIYLDQIRDLLSTENWMKQMNKASDYQPTKVTVEQATDVYDLLDTARANRVVGETSCNARSSRSHSLFQLTIRWFHAHINDGKEQEGAINLIDLAGSERLYKNGSNADKVLLNESTAINKSLSCLRDVISALANKDRHVPYRNSKLTYVLQPHLASKSSKTLMLVNASPLARHIGETVNSLRFASEVNSCIINNKKK